MTKNTYTHLFWDFNGTLLDDLDACLQSANRLLSAHGLPILSSRAHYLSLFGFPIIDYYRRLGFDFEKTPYSELAVEWVNYYLENAADAPLCQGALEALEMARAHGLSQWILSATELSMLRGQAQKLEILPYFDGILGLDNIHAYSKEALGVAWRASHPDARVLMLGDTAHDAATAAAMGADCILLTTGHATREALAASPCLFVAENAKEALLRIL